MPRTLNTPEQKEAARLHRAAYYERRREHFNRLARDNYQRRKADYTVRARKSHIKLKYGMTLEGFDAMLAAQGNLCAICGREPWEAGQKVLHIDHCHASGAIRGLLCQECNHGLGNFRDMAYLLRKAADYLLRPVFVAPPA